VIDQLNNWTQKYSEDGINQTPTFVINGTQWEANLTADLWPQLDQALTRATGG